jgi:hypothetical protein
MKTPKAKHIVLLLLCFIVCTSCKTEKTKKPQVSKKIEVEFKPNIHTSHIIELFVWPGEYPTRPMVVKAQQQFAPYKNHPAIKFSDSLLKNEIFYFDELTEILLYVEDFPSSNFKYSLKNSPYASKINTIQKWVDLLAKFYVDADVATFLKENSDYYQNAKKEVLKNLPSKDFVQQIESYYRSNRIKYIIVPAPEMPTGGAYGQRGIGPYVYTDNGMEIYQIISASLPVSIDSRTQTYKYFGFNNKEFTLRNSYHEFGHAFVNPALEIEKYKALVDSYEHLFTEELKRVMLPQNYDSWFICIAEHLVRLGEIRLAERSGQHEWAIELRKKHTKDLNFIFLPELEEKIKLYEQDETIESFEAYLPELLSVLDAFNETMIAERI